MRPVFLLIPFALIACQGVNERVGRFDAGAEIEAETAGATTQEVLSVDARVQVENRTSLVDSALPDANEPAVELIELNAAAVTLKRTNIRIGPGLEHDIVDTVEVGTPLTVSGRTANDWLLINRSGVAFGYVFANLVTLAQ